MGIPNLTSNIPEAEFAELATGLVTDNAPRRFALLVEEGEREDGWIVGWGLAFPDHAHVIGVGGRAGGMGMGNAGPVLGLPAGDTRMRLVWVDPPRPGDL